MGIEKFDSTKRKKYQEKVQRRLFQYMRRILFALRNPSRKTQPVFFLGYGRSGTTMLQNTFERDMRVEVLRENDPKIAEDYLLVYERIVPAIEASKAKVLVMKPILNSFDAPELHEKYEHAKIIWMVRDYRDVVASAQKLFGKTVPDYMRQLVRSGNGSNWLSRGLPSESLEILRRLNSDAFEDDDWMALIWWAVNRVLVTNNLCRSKRFLLVEYEKLVKNPERLIHEIYDFIGLPYKQQLGAYVHAASLGKGSDIKLDAVVDEMCASLRREITATC